MKLGTCSTIKQQFGGGRKHRARLAFPSGCLFCEVLLHGRENILTLIVINCEYAQERQWRQTLVNSFLSAKCLCLLT